MFRALLFLLAIGMPLAAAPRAPESPEAIAREILAPLLDPVKVASLKGDRPANARLYRILYWLETARRAGGKVPDIIGTAQAATHDAGTPHAQADARAILAAHARLAAWRCYGPAGMEELRRGGSPTIQDGPHAGEDVHIDHVLPVSIGPELRARFYNLRPQPAAVNLAKGNRIGPAEAELARRWHRAGLLSSTALAAVNDHARP